MALAPERRFAANSRRVIINSNFTFNVLTGHREQWLRSAFDACQRLGAEALISQHRADKPLPRRMSPAVQPMRFLLSVADVLVSRFSTVPFEAMARGVPFVYHNPHGERVPAFQDPDGAFLASDGVGSLCKSIETALTWRGNYRRRSWEFFSDQVDVDPARASEARAADVLLNVLGA